MTCRKAMTRPGAGAGTRPGARPGARSGARSGAAAVAVAVAAILVVAPPLLTACGGKAGRTGAAATAARHITVLVAATEMRFTLSQRSGPPAVYTFVLSNAGRARHALAIRGPGVAATSEPADGGGEAELTVTLHEGAYTLWCPIGRHRRLGMETGFTVR